MELSLPKEEQQPSYNILVAQPELEIMQGFTPVAATRIRLMVGGVAAGNLQPPEICGQRTLWKEVIVLAGVRKWSRDMKIEVHLEGQLQPIVAHTSICFANERKKIGVVGDTFRGHICLKLEAHKCQHMELLSPVGIAPLWSNLQIQLSEQVIDQEDSVEELPLQAADSEITHSYKEPQQLPQSPMIEETSEPATSRIFSCKHVWFSTKAIEQQPMPMPITIEVPFFPVEKQLTPLLCHDVDDELVIFGLEDFEHVIKNCSTAATVVTTTPLDQSYQQTQQLIPISQYAQTDRPRQSFSWLHPPTLMGDNLFADADDSCCSDTETTYPQASSSTFGQKLMYQQKNMQQLEYSTARMEGQKEHDVSARSVKYIEKWPELYDTASDQARDIQRLVRIQLSNLRCRVLNMEVEVTAAKQQGHIGSVVPVPIISRGSGELREQSQTHKHMPSVVKEEPQPQIKSPKQVRVEHPLQNCSSELKLEPLTEFARSLRSAFGDKIYQNKSATTLQKSVLCYSVPKANRFQKPRLQQAGNTYFTGSCFQPSKTKGTSFGYGNRKAYPLWLERNMKENPAPNSYQQTESISPRLPKGYSFGLSYHYYQKASIFQADQPKKLPAMPQLKKPRVKSRRQIYLALQKLSSGSNGNYHFSKAR